MRLEEACPQWRAEANHERKQTEDERKRGEGASSPCAVQGQSRALHTRGLCCLHMTLSEDGTSRIDLGVREPNPEQSMELPKVTPSKPELEFLPSPPPMSVQGWGWGGKKALCVGMGPRSWKEKVY